MLDIRITAESAADFYAQMRDLVMQGDVYFTPWEQPKPEPQPEPEPVKEEPAPTPKKTTTKKAKKAEPKPEPKPEPEPAKEEPAPAVQAVSLEELKAAAVKLNDDYGDGTFREKIKNVMHFPSMAKLDEAGRVEVLAAITAYRAEHAS